MTITIAPDVGVSACRSCGRPRGNQRSGWEPITRGESVVGYTCPDCPRVDEPIRRLVTATGIRFRAVVDATPRGSRERKQATRTLPTLTAAREWVGEVRTAVGREGGYLRVSDAESVRELAERWLASRIGVRPVTVEGYRTALRPALAYLGDRKPGDVRKSDVQLMLAWALREGGRTHKGADAGRPLSPRSVQYATVALAQVFDMAVSDGLVTANPVRQVKRSEMPRQAERVGRSLPHWQPAQLVKFREQADLDALAGVFRLSLSGLTRADVHGLRWSDLDLDAGTVTIRQGRVAMHGKVWTDAPKSAQRRRTVPYERIWPGTSALLRQLRAKQATDRLAAGPAWTDSGLVIVDALGHPEHPEHYSDRFRAITAEAGLPSIRLHALRHSLAFWLHSLGLPPADCAALLGHRVDVFLSTYLPEGGETGVNNAAAVLGRAIAAAV